MVLPLPGASAGGSSLIVGRHRYKSADEARRAYELVGGLKAQDVTLGARTEAADGCDNPSCRNDPDARRTTINEVERCSRCKREWRFFERGSLGVSIRGSTEGIAKRMHGQQLELAILANIITRRPHEVSAKRWSAMHAAWALIVYGQHDTGFVSRARGIIARIGVFNDRTIWELSREIRETIEKRLRKRGLMEE